MAWCIDSWLGNERYGLWSCGISTIMGLDPFPEGAADTHYMYLCIHEYDREAVKEFLHRTSGFFLPPNV